MDLLFHPFHIIPHISPHFFLGGKKSLNRDVLIPWHLLLLLELFSVVQYVWFASICEHSHLVLLGKYLLCWLIISWMVDRKTRFAKAEPEMWEDKRPFSLV